MKKTVLALTVIPLWINHVSAESFTFNSFSGGSPLAIPDNGATTDTETITSSSVTTIQSITVSLNIGGIDAFNGDLFATLLYQNGSGPVLEANLLNRPGKTALNSFGYVDNGMQVQLNDSAVNGDIHTYQLTLDPHGNQLTGTWRPDGRSATPDTVTDASPRNPAPLSVFNGQDANGTWTLLIGDASLGGTAQLNSWGLDFAPVPEPEEWAAISGAGLLGFAIWRRRKQNSATALSI